MKSPRPATRPRAEKGGLFYDPSFYQALRHPADGRAVTAYTLTNDAGMSVTAFDLGATIQSILLPTSRGPVDVALGYPDLEGYLVSRGHLGALIGRNANRLGGAFVEINGVRYPVTATRDRISCTAAGGL